MTRFPERAGSVGWTGERPHHAIAAFALEIEPGIKSRTNFAHFGVIATSRFQ
jgi:hypothetical protein